MTGERHSNDMGKWEAENKMKNFAKDQWSVITNVAKYCLS